MHTGQNILFALLLATAAVGCGKLEEYPNPKSVYNATFGMAPSAQVANLQAYGTSFRDSGHCYLRFNAPYSFLQTLVGTRFTEVSAASFVESTSNAGITGPTPSWWTPPTNSTSKFFSSTNFHP